MQNKSMVKIYMKWYKIFLLSNRYVQLLKKENLRILNVLSLLTYQTVQITKEDAKNLEFKDERIKISGGHL